MVLNKWLFFAVVLLLTGLGFAGAAVFVLQGPWRAAAATVAVVDFAVATFMSAKGIAEERRKQE